MNLCVLTEEDLLLIAETAANATDLSIHSASTFLTGKFKWGTLPAQWVPEWLHPAQLQTGAELLVDILNKWDPDSEVFFHSAGTGDGTRLDLWDHEDKAKSDGYEQAQLLQSKSRRWRGNGMVIRCWDARALCLLTSCRAKEHSIYRHWVSAESWPELPLKSTWNAPPESFLTAAGRLLIPLIKQGQSGELQWKIMRQPLLSLDLALSVFFLFSNTEKSWKGSFS